jgi:hypothetical protein
MKLTSVAHAAAARDPEQEGRALADSGAQRGTRALHTYFIECAPRGAAHTDTHAPRSPRRRPQPPTGLPNHPNIV